MEFLSGQYFWHGGEQYRWVGATVIQSAKPAPIYGPAAYLVEAGDRHCGMVRARVATIWYVRRRQGNLTIQDEIAVYKPIQLPAKSPASAASE